MEDADDIDSKDLTASNVMYACYSLFVYYLQQDDVDTKCAALRALSGVFTARPRVMLMLEEDGTIKDIMSPSSPVALQLESLQCWKEILLVRFCVYRGIVSYFLSSNLIHVLIIAGRR